MDRLQQLRPLLGGVDRLMLNGDTLDTRPSRAPDRTAALAAEVREFFRSETAETVFLTGNHDADFSAQHTADLAEGRVFATHGDVLFEKIVPWGRDAARIGRLLAAEQAGLSRPLRDDLEAQLAIWRRVAASIPQRHQSEGNPFKYAAQLAADTVWPPLRVFRILHAWRVEPQRAAALLRRHRPRAKFILTGHTHRPGLWRMPDGVVTINTGAFSWPLGSQVVDVDARQGTLVVRRVVRRRGEFHLADVVASFALE